MHRPWHTIGILAFTQITSWGSLYYAFSILAPSIGHDLALRHYMERNYRPGKPHAIQVSARAAYMTPRCGLSGPI